MGVRGGVEHERVFLAFTWDGRRIEGIPDISE